MNEDGKLKPGESLTKQFDYYNGTFDEANITSQGQSASSSGTCRAK